jgi:hypothetical protein
VNFDLKGLVSAAVDTVRDPREGARRVMALQIPRHSRWEAVLLVVVLSALLSELTLLLGSASGGMMMGGGLLHNPLAMGALQLAVLMVLIWGMYIIGRLAGGTGSLDDAIMLVVWLQAIMLGLQVVQLAVMLLLPPLASLIGLGGILLFFYLLTMFTTELHGFSSPGAVFIAILGAMVGFIMVFSFILAMFGVQISGA